jgi:hypothetical protein
MVLRYDNKCASDLLALKRKTRVTFLVEKFGIFRSSAPIWLLGLLSPDKVKTAEA